MASRIDGLEKLSNNYSRKGEKNLSKKLVTKFLVDGTANSKYNKWNYIIYALRFNDTKVSYVEYHCDVWNTDGTYKGAKELLNQLSSYSSKSKVLGVYSAPSKQKDGCSSFKRQLRLQTFFLLTSYRSQLDVKFLKDWDYNQRHPDQKQYLNLITWIKQFANKEVKFNSHTIFPIHNSVILNNDVEDKMYEYPLGEWTAEYIYEYLERLKVHTHTSPVSKEVKTK
jgi:hypothetical protein